MSETPATRAFAFSILDAHEFRFTLLTGLTGWRKIVFSLAGSVLRASLR
jgi:hypothetical protein